MSDPILGRRVGYQLIAVFCAAVVVWSLGRGDMDRAIFWLLMFMFWDNRLARLPTDAECRPRP